MSQSRPTPLRAKPPAAQSQRLAKVIARAGLCSRREAEVWIGAGRVAVNGEIIRTPAFNVSDSDAISVDDEPLTARQSTRLWLYHKPSGLVVTVRDPQGRPNVFDAIALKGLPRVVSVGRLDINTEGLLLLTNDGGLKRVLELPSTGWLRRYRVRAHGQVTQEALDGLKKGMVIDGVSYGAIEARLEREQGSNVWLDVALREGKNREIKNVLAQLGLVVNRLIRVSFGPFQLGDIPVGSIVAVRGKVLRDQLGKRLSEEAGVFFDSAADLVEPDAPEVAKVKRVLDPNKRMNRTQSAKSTGRKAAVPRGKTGAPRVDKVVGQRPDRPGGRPSVPGRPARVPEPLPMGRIVYDDGREPEEFIRRAPSAKDAKPSRLRPSELGAGSGRPRRDDKPRSDKPHGAGRDKKFGDRPDRDKKFGDRPDRDKRSQGDAKPANDRGRSKPAHARGASKPANVRGGDKKPVRSGPRPGGAKR